MKPSKEISRLIDIMAALRTPGTGCPWDLVQDFKSIAPYTIEEAYEVADAIERNDIEDLRLELGDLLLQSVYHARMAEEAGYFDFGDVVEGVTEKMIRRHPHVFGDERSRDVGMAKGTWERIKTEEKRLKAERKSKLGLSTVNNSDSLLDDVPGSLPPLMAAVKLQKQASKVGFDWNDPKAVISKIREELEEVEQEIENGFGSEEKLEAELGDVLFAVANLARHFEIEPDKALRHTNTKFRNRFRFIEENVSETGHSMESADLDTMESLWQKSKTMDGSKP